MKRGDRHSPLFFSIFAAIVLAACGRVVPTLPDLSPDPVPMTHAPTASPPKTSVDLQALVDSTPQGETLTLVDSFLIETPIAFKKPITLKGDGSFTHAITARTGQQSLFIASASGISIKSLAINLEDSQGLVSAVAPAITGGVTYSRLTIQSCRITVQGDSAAAVSMNATSLINNTINGLRLGPPQAPLLSLKGSPAALEGNVITDPTSSYTSAFLAYDSTNLRLVDNLFIGSGSGTQGSAAFFNTNNIVITGNTLLRAPGDASGAAMSFSGCDGASVSGQSPSYSFVALALSNSSTNISVNGTTIQDYTLGQLFADPHLGNYAPSCPAGKNPTSSESYVESWQLTPSRTYFPGAFTPSC